MTRFREHLMQTYGITYREARLIDLALKGIPVSDIAKIMSVHPQSAKGYFHRLQKKLGVNRQSLLKKFETEYIEFSRRG